MRRASWSSRVILAILLVQALPVAAAEAESASAGSGRNVQITLTISHSGGSNLPQPVLKLLGQDGSQSRMLVGWRTPIPTVSAARDETDKAPVTTFVYQNIGVSTELMVRLLGQGNILLEGQIEISGAREGPPVGSGGERAPLIGTFQQALKVIAKDGQKLRVAEGPDPEGGTVSLDIQASVLQ